MQLLHADDTRRFIALHLQRPYRFESPFAGEEFALLLLACDTKITPEEQQALSAAFVAQCCRYAVCAGHECSSWDDSIDEASILRDCPDPDPPASRFVMTSSHDDEAVPEAAWFFVHCTTFYDATSPPTRYVIACLGGTPDDDALLKESVLEAIRDA